MIEMILAASIILWVLCVVLTWGLVLGHFSYYFPYFDHRGIAFIMAIPGLVGLLAHIEVVLRKKERFHFRLIPLSTAVRWEIYKKTYPGLKTSRKAFIERYDKGFKEAVKTSWK